MAQAQAMRRFSNAWRLEAGLAYDDAFGDPQLFPVGGAVWPPGDEWTVNLLFPAPSIYWAPTRELGLFTFLRPSGNRWVDRDDEGKWIYVIEGWRAGLGLERRLWKHLWLRLEGGREFARHYEVHHDGRCELDENADDTWFARAALVGYGISGSPPPGLMPAPCRFRCIIISEPFCPCPPPFPTGRISSVEAQITAGSRGSFPQHPEGASRGKNRGACFAREES